MSREPSKTEGNNNNNSSNTIDLILAGVVMSGRRNGTPRRHPCRRAGLDNHRRNGEENIIVKKNKNKNNAARPRVVRLEPRALPKISWTYCLCSCHVVVCSFQ